MKLKLNIDELTDDFYWYTFIWHHGTGKELPFCWMLE